MYEPFFGLQCEPFSVAPDPRFLFLSAKHRDALAHLQYGLRGGGGLVLLTGEIGAGKTTVWRTFLEQLPPNFDVAYVVNPRLGAAALLSRVCEDLGVTLADGADPIDALHGHLLLTHAGGRRTLIVVDEAQALSVDVLEQLRLLTNLVTADRKLVQVLLIGQPELRTMLEQPVLEPTAQRVVARYHLTALSADESTAYIAHRLRVAGLQGDLPFDGDALSRIHQLCGGVPRRINVLCDRALLRAGSAGLRRVDQATVDQVAPDVFGLAKPAAARVNGPARLPGWPALAGVALLAGAAGAWLAPGWRTASAPALVQAASAGATGAPPVSASTRAAAPPAADNGALPRTEVASATVLDALFASPLSADEPRAWRALAGQWGVVLGAGDPCAAALQQALHCYRGRGGLVPIRQIDRPLVITLADERGRVAHAVLVGLADSTATLRVGDLDHALPLAQLARVWRGDFATFWRAPPGYQGGDAVVAGGPLAGWLADRLAGLDRSLPVATGGEALTARVLAFQLAHGLTADGLAGPLTLMQLNRASGIDEPRLLARR
jgi:general secretion pathway protein A